MSLIEDDRESLSVYETADEDSEAESPGFHTPRQDRNGSPRATFLFTNKNTTQQESQIFAKPATSSVEQLINEHSNPYSVSPLVRGSASVRSPSLISVPQHRQGSSLRSSSLPSRRTTRRLSSPFTPRLRSTPRMGQALGRSRGMMMGGSSPVYRNTDLWIAEVEEGTTQNQNELHKQARKIRRGRRGRGRRRMRKALEAAIGQKLPATVQELVERVPDDFELDRVAYKPRARRRRRKIGDGSDTQLRTVYLGGLKARLAEHRDNKSYQSQESQETLPFDTT